MAEDPHGLMSGSMFFRNTEAMKLLLDIWKDPILVNYANEKFRWRDQDLLLHLMVEHPVLREKVGWVDGRLINSYDVTNGATDMRWRPGDFVAHFPGCWYEIFFRRRTDKT